MENMIYEDENYQLFEDPEEGLILTLNDSCRYKVANTESDVIRYLCAKIAELKESLQKNSKCHCGSCKH